MTNSRQTFSDYDRQRIAVLLEVPWGRRVLTGNARYVADPWLGKSLRICPDDWFLHDDGYELILVESEWKGAILPDRTFGCESCFIPSPSINA